MLALRRRSLTTSGSGWSRRARPCVWVRPRAPSSLFDSARAHLGNQPCRRDFSGDVKASSQFWQRLALAQQERADYANGVYGDFDYWQYGDDSMLTLQDESGRQYYILGVDSSEGVETELPKLLDRVRPDSIMVTLREEQGQQKPLGQSMSAMQVAIRLADERGLPVVYGVDPEPISPLLVYLATESDLLFFKFISRLMSFELPPPKTLNESPRVQARRGHELFRVTTSSTYRCTYRERALYMIKSLKARCPGRVVVGVVDIGDLDDIQRYWGQEFSRSNWDRYSFPISPPKPQAISEGAGFRRLTDAREVTHNVSLSA